VNVIQKAVFLSHFKSGLEWLLEKTNVWKLEGASWTQQPML
jgi:hypothetical protein